MNFTTIGESLAQFSKQLSIIQDFITIKFGAEFEEYYQVRSNSEDDFHSFGNPSDLNLGPIVDSESGSDSNSSFDNTNASKVSRSQWDGPDGGLTASIISSSCINPEAHLQLVDIKTEKEDDFFDETEGCNDEDDEEDPLVRHFFQGMDERFHADHVPGFAGQDTEGTSSASGTSRPKRKYVKKKIAEGQKAKGSISEKAEKRMEIQTTTPGLIVYPSDRGKGFYSAIFKDFLYTYHKEGRNKRIFRCSKHLLSCKGRIHLSLNYKKVVREEVGNHNHSSCPAEANAKYKKWRTKSTANQAGQELAISKSSPKKPSTSYRKTSWTVTDRDIINFVNKNSISIGRTQIPMSPGLKSEMQ